MSTAAHAAPRSSDAPAGITRSRLGGRLLLVGVLIAVVVLVIVFTPGLGSLRTRFSHAAAGWLVAGAALKVLSGLSYVLVFRSVFCRSMSWRHSGEIGLSEWGANALVPTGGTGGLALGAWALRREGMKSQTIARRSVAFFLLTSLPNVAGVLILGLGMGIGLFGSDPGPLRTFVPAAIAAAAIILTLASGPIAAAAHARLAHSRGAGARLPRVLDALAGGVRESVQLLREHDARLVAGLVGYLGFDVMILWATFHAFGAAPALATIWIAYLIGELGGLIPIPGGIGGVDLGLVGALVLYHVPVNEATAAVLAYRALALWVPAALGAGAFVLLRRSMARQEREQVSSRPARDPSHVAA